MFGSAKTLLVSLFAVGLIATACGSSTKSGSAKRETTTSGGAKTASHEMGEMTSFFLKAADQNSHGKTVVVNEAVLTGTSGWVTINEDSGGAMGKIIGESTLLPAGTNKDVVITLMHPLTASAKVFAVLHVEDNNNTTFDFPNGDQPAKAGGEVVDVPIQIDVM